MENVVGLYALPFAIAPNFIIAGRDHLLPLVIEEPSVVAAMANAARLARAGGGFETGSTEPVMIGQIQLLNVPYPDAAIVRIQSRKQELLAKLARCTPPFVAWAAAPRFASAQARGHARRPHAHRASAAGHARCDGSQRREHRCETLSPELEAISGGRALLASSPNLSDQRRPGAAAASRLPGFDCDQFSGQAVAARESSQQGLRLCRSGFGQANTSQGLFSHRVFQPGKVRPPGPGIGGAHSKPGSQA